MGHRFEPSGGRRSRSRSRSRSRGRTVARKLEHRLRGVMRTARRASTVEVPSFLRQLARETERMVTFFFRGGNGSPRDSSGEEDEDEDTMPSPYLDRPQLTKHTAEGGTKSRITYALAGMQGWRAQMEDAHACVPELDGELAEWGYYAVFDGHAGTTVAQYCARNLLTQILASGTYRAIAVPTLISSHYARRGTAGSVTRTG